MKLETKVFTGPNDAIEKGLTAFLDDDNLATYSLTALPSNVGSVHNVIAIKVFKQAAASDVNTVIPANTESDVVG